MIAVKLEGRTGNQMFQYAFAYLTAKKRGVQFCLKNAGSYRLKYFECDLDYNALFNKLKTLYFDLRYAGVKKFSQTGNEIPGDVLTQISKYHDIEGFFQSEFYFDGYENEVRRLFQVKDDYKKKFENKFGSLFANNKTIVVHVRLGDYKNWNMGEKLGGIVGALPFSYPEKVLSQFDDNSYKVIFISDEIEAVRKYFGGNKNYIYEQNEEIVDLQILMNADVLCLANSSFSWWGAYLNEKKNKQVFAPKYWLGFKTKMEYPNGVICKEWNAIEI